ncbi:MAG: MFS transporter [Nanoarchaeota archaeon]|nr:MFS transporter [Nanoarchaeota archaeon]MBU4299628.1 MFS transporter [Nanoarchaeota archaeon]MBU4452618.1 MFS transporter [Nanoarchaeota archaeon]MCG2723915.1 MFS transporter [archaeon]
MLANIKKMNLIQFFINMHFLAAVTIPFFTVWGGLTFSETMLLQSLFIFAWAVFEVPTGAFADKFGRKKSIIIGCFSIALAAFIYGSVPNIYVFMLGEVLWALGLSFISGADEAIIYDTLKTLRRTNDSKSVFARYSMALSLAFIIASPIGSIIAVKFGMNYPMIFTGIPAVFAGFVAMTLKEPKRKILRAKKHYFRIIAESISYIQNHPKLRPLVIDSILGGTMLYYILWLYQVMLANSGAEIFQYGWISAGMNIFAILLLSQIARLDAFFGKRNLIRATVLIPGIAFIAGAFTQNFAITIILIFAIMGFRGLRTPLFSSYFNIHIPSGKRATMLSAISMLGRFLAAALNLAVGIMMDWSVQGTMVSIGAVLLILGIFSGVRETDL